ncbi:MAG: hypothetical protein HGA78_07975 [Nitrospirales bacterium]|nr:hypothetical protein [Nitrospirales bacterium]
MEVGAVLKEGVDIIKRNPVLIVPAIALNVIIAILALILLGGGVVGMGMMGLGMRSPGSVPAAFGAFAGIAILMGIVSWIVSLFVHGMTVGMAQEAVERGFTNIGDGMRVGRECFVNLLGGSVLVGLVVMIGLILLIIPGLVAVFLLMFTFVAIVVEDVGPVEGMKRSYELTRTHVGDLIIFFVVLMVVGLLVALVSSVFSFIPILGQAIRALISGVFSSYVAVVMVLVYREISQPNLPSQM